MGLDGYLPSGAASLQRDTDGKVAVSSRLRAIVPAGLAFLLAVGLIGAVGAWEIQGRVVGITDGDTLTILHAGRQQVIRLHGIDAPEKGQAFGERAKQFTSSLAFWKTVVVRVRGRDRYERTIGDVFLPDGRHLNQEVVRVGYAWWYRRYSADQRLAMLEAEARAARRGLWSDPSPCPPWEWRKDRPLTGPRQRGMQERSETQRLPGLNCWPTAPWSGTP
jgi:endonuclease YncB( thermonuclease family)